MISRKLMACLVMLAMPISGGAQEIRQAHDLGGLEARSAALILSGQEGGDLSLEVLAIPMPTSSKSMRVALVVDIGPTPASSEDASPLTEIYAYVLEDDNQIAAFFTQVIALDPGKGSVVKFFGELEVEPGRYALQILVRHRPSGLYGLRRVALVVPSTESFLLPPILHDAGNALLFRQAATEASRTATTFPEITEGRSLLPAAKPLVAPGGGLAFFLAGRGLPGSANFRLLDRQRRELDRFASVELDLLALDSGLEWHRVELEGIDLGGLTQGQYFLEAAVDGSEDPVLLAFSIASAEGSPEPIPAAPLVPTHRTELAEVTRAYATALELFAAGQEDAARTSLAELESSFLLQAKSKDQDRLVQSFLDVGEELGALSAEILLPLLLLHEELYRVHHPARRYQLSTHARRMVEGLTELYDGLKSNSAGEGRALASLAGYLQAFDSTAAARVQFENALRFDPSLPAALLGLATLNEAYGDYAAAIPLLERALAERPDSDEVSLRLAINLVRLDRDRRAKPLLQAALESESEWICVVASQELARLHMKSRKPEAAVRVLEQALEAHPDYPRLQIQLAAALDRSGRNGEARWVLSRLDPRLGSEAHSPRFIYSRWPMWAIEEAREGLAEEARNHFGELSDALDRLFPETTTR